MCVRFTKMSLSCLSSDTSLLVVEVFSWMIHILKGLRVNSAKLTVTHVEGILSFKNLINYNLCLHDSSREGIISYLSKCHVRIIISRYCFVCVKWKKVPQRVRSMFSFAVICQVWCSLTPLQVCIIQTVAILKVDTAALSGKIKSKFTLPDRYLPSAHTHGFTSLKTASFWKLKLQAISRLNSNELEITAFASTLMYNRSRACRPHKPAR